MLDVRLLGQFEVLQDGKRVAIPTRNAQSLFAYLILNAKRFHRLEKLSGLLWPDSSEENARSNLRHELWRLRKAFEADGVRWIQLAALFETPFSQERMPSHKLENRLSQAMQGALVEEIFI